MSATDQLPPSAEVQAKLDEAVWLYMRGLRRIFHWDRDIIPFIGAVIPDVVALYGEQRLLEMANGMHTPERFKAGILPAGDE